MAATPEAVFDVVADASVTSSSTDRVSSGA